MNELKKKGQLNATNNLQLREKISERFEWTDILLTQAEKQALKDIVLEHHENFATHRMNIGMKTEFKMLLTPKDDKAVEGQSLPMLIHLK